jgi:hypothetical protein
MKTFYDYLNDTMRDYKYRIRTVQKIDDEALARIQYILAKYDVLDIERPKKTIFQARPLDFVTMPAAEVYIIDVVTHLPMSPFIVQQELTHALNIAQDMLIVRSDYDPSEIQVQRQEELELATGLAAADGLSTGALLSSDPSYPEYVDPTAGVPIAGQEYNNNFLRYLAKVAADRITVVPDIDPATYNKFYNSKLPPVNPDNYPGDKVVPKHVFAPGAKIAPPVKTSPYGNFDDTIRPMSRTYLDKDGKKVIVTAKSINR